MHPSTGVSSWQTRRLNSLNSPVARTTWARRSARRAACRFINCFDPIHGQGRCGKGQSERSPIHAFYHDDLVVPDYLVTVKVLALEPRDELK